MLLLYVCVSLVYIGFCLELSDILLGKTKFIDTMQCDVSFSEIQLTHSIDSTSLGNIYNNSSQLNFDNLENIKVNNKNTKQKSVVRNELHPINIKENESSERKLPNKSSGITNNKNTNYSNITTCDRMNYWDVLRNTGIAVESGASVCLKLEDLLNCTDTKGPISDVTLVTALIDLDRSQWRHFRRRFTDYLHYAIPVLNLHIPMIIYVENKTKEFVFKHRKGKEHMTKIILTELEDLEYYDRYDHIKNIMQSEAFRNHSLLLTHPEGFSPEYNILMNSKLSLLRLAARRNYFKNNYYFWIDIGYGHGTDIFPKDCYWTPRNLMKGRDVITYIMLNKLSMLTGAIDLYQTRLPPFVNGGFFGGSRVAINRYYFLHRDIFLDFLDKGMVDDDQTMAVACYFKNKYLFNMVEGWWYDVFKLFR